MGIESACIPLPSEIIMPFSGYLVFRGEFGLFRVALAGGFGCVVGPFRLLPRTLRWASSNGTVWKICIDFPSGSGPRRPLVYTVWGDWAIFSAASSPSCGPLSPFRRGRPNNFPRFIIYTFVGSFPWCLGLAYIGMKLGHSWNTLGAYFHNFDIVIGILIVAGAVYYIWRHLKNRKHEP